LTATVAHITAKSSLQNEMSVTKMYALFNNSIRRSRYGSCFIESVNRNGAKKPSDTIPADKIEAGVFILLNNAAAAGA